MLAIEKQPPLRGLFFAQQKDQGGMNVWAAIPSLQAQTNILEVTSGLLAALRRKRKREQHTSCSLLAQLGRMCYNRCAFTKT